MTLCIQLFFLIISSRFLTLQCPSFDVATLELNIKFLVKILLFTFFNLSIKYIVYDAFVEGLLKFLS